MPTECIESKRAYKLARCTLCKFPLPGRIPRKHAASRCAPCQMKQHFVLAKVGRKIEHAPENMAIIESRIALYQLRASANLPLFDG